jgi:hypothetical protein
MTMGRRSLAGALTLLLLACGDPPTTGPDTNAGDGQPAGGVDGGGAGGGGAGKDGGDAGGGTPEAAGDGAIVGDVYKAIFDQVDKAGIKRLLDEMTGAVPVSVDGASIKITERWSPAAKANFRKYWSAYMTALGATVTDVPFSVPNLVGETQGHTVEAVLPGQSAD